MLYIFEQIITTTTYYVHYYIQRFICTYILQGDFDRAYGHGHVGHISGMGAGHPPCKLVRSIVNVLLICCIFVVYGNAIIFVYTYLKHEMFTLLLVDMLIGMQEPCMGSW